MAKFNNDQKMISLLMFEFHTKSERVSERSIAFSKMFNNPSPSKRSPCK